MLYYQECIVISRDYCMFTWIRVYFDSAKLLFFLGLLSSFEEAKEWFRECKKYAKYQVSNRLIFYTTRKLREGAYLAQNMSTNGRGREVLAKWNQSVYPFFTQLKYS